MENLKMRQSDERPGWVVERDEKGVEERGEGRVRVPRRYLKEKRWIDRWVFYYTHMWVLKCIKFSSIYCICVLLIFEYLLGAGIVKYSVIKRILYKKKKNKELI